MSKVSDINKRVREVLLDELGHKEFEKTRKSAVSGRCHLIAFDKTKILDLDSFDRLNIRLTLEIAFDIDICPDQWAQTEMRYTDICYFIRELMDQPFVDLPAASKSAVIGDQWKLEK